MKSEDKQDIARELAPVAPLGRRLSDLSDGRKSPFLKEELLDKVRYFAILVITEMAEKLLGKKLFVKIFGDELDLVSRSTKYLLQALLESRVLETFSFFPTPPDWPKIIYATSSLTPVQRESGRETKLVGSNGDAVALDHDAAARVALAEALERHSLCVYNPDRLVKGSFEELKSQGAVNPQKFSAFSEKQLENLDYRKRHWFDETTVFRWIEAKSLLDNRKYLVPAQLVFMFYELLEGEPIIRRTTTSGAAAGSSWKMAAYNALCETIERDSFMIFWLNRLAPPKIDLSSVQSEFLQNILKETRKHNISIEVLDLTTDLGVPTVGAISLDQQGRYPIHISTRTGLDIQSAIERVVLDHLKVGLWDSFFPEETTREINALAPRLRSIRHRQIFWADPPNQKEIEFLLKGPTTKTFKKEKTETSYSQRLQVLTNIIKNQGLEAYLVDATSTAAKDAGLIVLMSLIPGLYPMYLDEDYKYLGIKRLYDSPVKMGYLKNPRREEEMNQTPHPFV